MEAIAFASVLFATARTIKETEEKTGYAQNFHAFGRPWERNVNPNLGLNKYHHPESNLVNGHTNSFHKLPAKQVGQSAIQNRLRTQASKVTQRTNHHIVKNYRPVSLRSEYGNGVSGHGQHAGFGKHDTGQVWKRPAKNARSHRPGKVNEGTIIESGVFLGNSTDFPDGPVHFSQML